MTIENKIKEIEGFVLANCKQADGVTQVRLGGMSIFQDKLTQALEVIRELQSSLQDTQRLASHNQLSADCAINEIKELKQALDFIYNDVLTDVDSDDYITKFELTRQAIEVALDIKQNQQEVTNAN